jgi:hypothetical protein
LKKSVIVEDGMSELAVLDGLAKEAADPGLDEGYYEDLVHSCFQLCIDGQ